MNWALAQESTTTDSSTTTTTTATDSSTTGIGTATSTTSQAFTTTIAVGRAGNTFEPNVVQVPVGGFVGMYSNIVLESGDFADDVE